MLHKSFHTDSAKGFKQAWAACTSDGFLPNATVIFSSVDLDLQEIVSFLNTRITNSTELLQAAGEALLRIRSSPIPKAISFTPSMISRPRRYIWTNM